MRVFLDANVLFSAAKSDGAVRQLLRLLRDGGHELWADPYTLEEARRNLETKSPGSLPDLERLTSDVGVAERTGDPASLPADLVLNESDRPVLASAIALGCEALVTGDRSHFGALYGKSVLGVTVYSPRDLADTLLKG